MDYIYCFRWNRGNNTAISPMSEDAAQKKFVKTKGQRVYWPLHIVCFEETYQEGARPFVEILTNRIEREGRLCRFMHMEFLNSALSVESVYLASEDRPGKLFLGQVLEYTYISNDQYYRFDESSKSIQYLFSPEGVVRERVNDKSQEIIQTFSRKGVDVSQHWTDVPEFGDWERFTRVREDLFPQ